MRKLLKKEFILAMHPTTPVMMLLSAMVLIPNYPYSVMFFYVSLAIFFTCLQGRENRDIVYALNLPICKSSIVKARILFTVLIQLAQLTLMVPFVGLSQAINPVGNQAGMNANIALFGLGFLAYGLFNLVFFTSYYRDVQKVGSSFLKACAVLFLCTVFDVVSTYAIPVVRDGLDTADPQFLPGKLIFLFTGIVIYAALTALSCKIGIRLFEKQDLN